MAARPTHNAISNGDGPSASGILLAFQFQGADQRRRSPKLVEREQPQCVTHQHRQTAMDGVRVAKAAQYEGEGGKPEIGFGLAAAGREEQEVDEVALDMSRIGDPAQIHEDVGELEGTPYGRGRRRRGAPFLLSAAAARGSRHGPVGCLEGLPHLFVGEQVYARLDAVRSTLCALQQFGGGLPASVGEWADGRMLLPDPDPISFNERVEQPPRSLEFGNSAERLHAEFDIIDACRLHPFDFGPRHPFRMHSPTCAVCHLGFCGDVVADRVVGNVPVVQVGHPLVPVVAVESARVHSRNKRPIGLDAHLDLKRKGRVLQIVVLGRLSPVYDEQRNRTRIQWPFRQRESGLPHQADDCEAIAVRDRFGDRLAGFHAGNVETDTLGSWNPFPGPETEAAG